jgi:hypothetical protein
MVSIRRKTIIDQNPAMDKSLKATAHGKRKAISRSKMINRIDTR